MALTASLALVAAALFGAAVGALAVLVIGVRRDDRAKNLTGAPATPVAAITRRALGVGVRHGRAHQDQDEER